MIGGRVLDTSAVVAFAAQTSVYASAVVWTAREADVVLLVPTTVVAAVSAALTSEAHEVLDVLLSLPVTVLDPLDAGRARVGRRAGRGPWDRPRDRARRAVRR